MSVGAIVRMGPFTLDTLNQYKSTPLPAGYPPHLRTFYSPVDNVPGVLQACFNAARHSLVVCMYGFDDPVLAAVVRQKLNSPGVVVQLTLDSTQASGVHERALLAQERYPVSSVAVGQSEDHAIMRMKLAIIDGIYVVTGSTNLSGGAETTQDNQLTVIADAVVAGEARARVDAIHYTMLQRTKAT
jgi:phosphatidylserine/phosphatidylglycerophosphate/cardiolipin synthase-like enzyme